LLPTTDKIRGCEVIVPETAIFVNGKAKYIIRNDKEHCVFAVRKKNKLNLQSIYKEFSNIVRERKKDSKPIFPYRSGQQ